ncbi:putative bifunctional transcriptional activator/DNA repair enzyme AlkA [Actinoplanes lobatus]|uniref:DNA-3-methyladenine glycosylase II n=1 Tax=Actinoplanes lobatus TaxID=113568 RepID=A0A7W7MEA7_9ACTN|nr:AlkA N-terminal domain-containing protein [Actinoplanes lobatus]MBB4747109.1 AraC family transcriptional regulator of adaptative response / DNA-3-methyladenine glycosylase II [Actinoplanes lobatus]GGN55761.1 putative bifunctional transcriptional activator/DNA repair enzyme AlkA [Actinoplanes lobatus]GIE39323.1 putative bifunctional transcriptional activator/DNA repair enzyme AlkA [Actinoplanes lobatus]
MELDFERCYRAVDSRDQRFDGCFYTAVRTTGIYCRPSCPAVTPKRENVSFYASAAAAQRGGYRACRRCRPDAAPGSPEWDSRADTVGRAMRLIGDGIVDREGVPGLAGRLGYTERHLNRMLTAELGAGPLALARAQRAQTARILVETTDLGLAEIAFAAGFGSVRQFNDTMLEVYAQAPSQLRERRPAERGEAGVVNLRLAYRSPLHSGALLSFFAARTLPGVDEVDGQTYRRGLNLPHGGAEVALRPGDRWVHATLRLEDVRDLAPAVARCRRLFDLDADPVAVDAMLGADPGLREVVAAEPGVRVPRAVDGFEMAVRAVVGQQVSVAGARTTLGRILRAAAASSGEPTPIPQTDPASGRLAGHPVADLPDDAFGRPATGHDTTRVQVAADGSASGRLAGFPAAHTVADLPDDAFGMPAARRDTIRALARVVADGKLDLDPGADRAETTARLTDLPGIGPWTAGYIAMRAIGDPDVFLATDLAARRGATALGLPDTARSLTEHAERWRPWRSYALIRLWRAA